MPEAQTGPFILVRFLELGTAASCLTITSPKEGHQAEGSPQRIEDFGFGRGWSRWPLAAEFLPPLSLQNLQKSGPAFMGGEHIAWRRKVVISCVVGKLRPQKPRVWP